MFCNLNIFIEAPEITVFKIQTKERIDKYFSKISFILEESLIMNFQVFSRKKFDANSFSKRFKVKLSESLFYQIVTRNFINRKTLGLIIDKIQTNLREKNMMTRPNPLKFSSKEQIKHDSKVHDFQTYIKSNYYFRMKNLHLKLSFNDAYIFISIYDPFSQKKENYFFCMIPLITELLISKSKPAFEKILESLFCFKNFIVGRKITSLCNQSTILASKPLVYQRENSFKLKKKLRKILNMVVFNKVRTFKIKIFSYNFYLTI